MRILGSKRLDLIVFCYIRAQQFLIVELYVYYLVEILWASKKYLVRDREFVDSVGTSKLWFSRVDP